MKLYLTPVLIPVLLVAASVVLPPWENSDPPKPANQKETIHNSPKIQAAILLDVSGSMDGLIEQAKAQLWNMVSVMGRAQCNGQGTAFEIALYEYGRSGNDPAAGYVKQLSPFTTDLDKLSQTLFALNTNGGDEYCGQVIYTSLQELQWDPSPDNYKVIFIAGNEDFLQGKLPYAKACDEAKQKGVIVNTIYCGDRLQGIREHWNLNSECGNGSFTVINHNDSIEDIPTPYDSLLFTLNNQLNSTYIAYGMTGQSKKSMQAEVDQMNYEKNKSAAAKRVTVKAKGQLYKNESWDLVDRNEMHDSEEFLKKLDKKTLPDSLQHKSQEELSAIINRKKLQRSKVQVQIETVSKQREDYLSEEKKRRAATTKAANLETEVEKIIREQAKRYNMIIE